MIALQVISVWVADLGFGAQIAMTHLAQCGEAAAIAEPALQAACAGKAGQVQNRPNRVWTEERNAILRRDWPAGVPTPDIRAALAKTDGPKISMTGPNVSCQAAYLGLRRPNACQSALPRAPAPPASQNTAPTLATAPAHTSLQDAHQPATKPPRIAPYVPPTKKAVSTPLPPTAQQRSRLADEAAIAAHIAAKGVTRCPTGVAAPTTATLNAADAAAQRQRNDKMREAASTEASTRAIRVAVNRARKLCGKPPVIVTSRNSSTRPS